MFSAIRTRLHLTPSTVIASLALVFAMSGGAYAASRYVITSTKQISPKVLKSLAGKAGPAGKNGANGAAGPAGAVGGTGPAGPQGPAGVAGGAGAAGAAGKEGKEGPPGTTGFTKTLPSGAAEQGVWTAETPQGSPQPGLGAISFTIPLAGPLDDSHVFYVAFETEVPQCPGSVEEPLAEKGDLCVYAGAATSLRPGSEGVIHAPRSSINNFTKVGALASGAIVELHPEEIAGVFEGGLAVGTWAVTAG
jgi:hypothetical protein